MLIPILILWEWDGLTPIPRVATDLVSRLAYFGFRPSQATTGHHNSQATTGRSSLSRFLALSGHGTGGQQRIIIHPYLISWCEVLENKHYCIEGIRAIVYRYSCKTSKTLLATVTGIWTNVVCTTVVPQVTNMQVTNQLTTKIG